MTLHFPATDVAPNTTAHQGTGKPTLGTLDLAGALALTGWLVVTGLSQHPARSFDRLRKYDRTGAAVPNWRFFAPEPATHDFRVLHRHLDHDGAPSPWRETNQISPRQWRQAVWFPQRRRDKAVFDMCTEMLCHMRTPGQDLTVTPAYRLLRDYVRATIDGEPERTAPPKGFQFVVATDSGYDEAEEPDYLFASRFEPWAQHAAG